MSLGNFINPGVDLVVKVEELSKDQIKAFDHLLRITTTDLRWEKLTMEQQQGFVNSVVNIIHAMDQIDKKEVKRAKI